MKIIDLLNKIANGEEVPNKIKYRNDIYILTDNYCYYCDETNLILSDRLFAEQSRLNDEVEIIEEEKKIPEKLNFNHKEFEDDVVKLEYKNQTLNIGNVLLKMADRIDKIIDYLDYLKSKGDE